MADLDAGTKIFIIDDLSKGVQRKSTRFQQAPNEVNRAEAVSFDEIGGFGKKLGYDQEGDDLTSTTSTSTSTSTTTTSTSTSTSSSTSTSTTTTA
jgi:hypothetical protein